MIGSNMTDLVTYVTRMPAPTKFRSRALAMGRGGKGRNRAVAATQRDAEATMRGKVGGAAFGAAALVNLEANAVDARHVPR